MALIDRRDEMTLTELVEELEVTYPERFATFESRHPDAMEAVMEDGIESPEEAEDEELAESLVELQDDIRGLLAI
jgi:hypothetical protein